MGLRFRRSVKILPGVRWNVGLRGSSISVGRRGATVNFSKRGTRATVGIPGTGLSYFEKISGPRKAARASAPSPPSLDADALGIPFATPRRIVALVALSLLFTPWPVLGLLGFVVAVCLPSRGALARRALDARMEELKTAASTLTENSSVEDVDRVLALAGAFPIESAARTSIIGNLEAMKAVIPLEREGRLIEVEGALDVLGPEPCYFFGPVFLDKHGQDENGTVYFGRDQVLFIGNSRVAFPWTKVETVTSDGAVVTIRRSDRKTPFRFVFSEAASAAKAGWVARMLVRPGTLAGTS